MNKLLIIKTGRAIKGIPASMQDFEHWTARAAGLSLDHCHTVTVIDGETLPEPSLCSGVVITGSAAMVSDRHAWSEYVAQWLLQAIDYRLPVLGICYGHQLLAHALGGVVDFHPGPGFALAVGIGFGDSAGPLFFHFPVVIHTRRCRQETE